jgi:hypothetical protein
MPAFVRRFNRVANILFSLFSFVIQMGTLYSLVGFSDYYYLFLVSIASWFLCV